MLVAAPMVETHADELACTGKLSTGVFHTLSAGKTGHPAMVGAPDAASERAARMNASEKRTLFTVPFRHDHSCAGYLSRDYAGPARAPDVNHLSLFTAS